jgi:DNA-binding transcriptional LysR family regulator
MDRNSLIKRRLRLRDLDTLLVVARCGSMAKAAVQLSMSQPAISKAIAEMEHTIGVRLLDRTSQGVEPTPYGRALLRSGTAIFDDLRLGITEIDALSDPAAGEIRLTASEPVAAGILPEIIARLSRASPRISIFVRQSPIAALQTRGLPYRDLQDRSVDLVLGPILNPLADENVEAETLFEERWVVTTGPQNPWRGRRKLTLADLIDEQWILPPLDTVLGAALTKAFEESGLELPKRKIESSTIQLQMGLLATQRIVTIFPSSLVFFGAKRLPIVALPVKFPVRPPPLGIITLKNRTISRVVQHFMEITRDVAKLLDKGRAFG